MFGKNFYQVIRWFYCLIVIDILILLSMLPIALSIALFEVRPRYSVFYFLFLLIGLTGISTCMGVIRKMIKDGDIYQPAKLFFQILKLNYKEILLFSFLTILLFYVIGYYLYLFFVYQSFFIWIGILFILFSTSFFLLGSLIVINFEGSGISTFLNTLTQVSLAPITMFKTMSILLLWIILIYYIPIVGILGGAMILFLFYQVVGKMFIEKIIFNQQKLAAKNS